MSEISLLLNDIKKALPELELRENEPMREHCSFKIGGPADVVALPSSIEQTGSLCRLLRDRGIAPLVIGNGTNLLITDRQLHRFVIIIGEKLSDITRAGETRVEAQCGVSLARLAGACAGWGLSGLEFAQGIPGSLGGAVCMNAGAYDGQMKDVLRAVTYLDEQCRVREKRLEELALDYRTSAFSDSRCVVLSASMELTPGSEEQILQKMRLLAQKRRASQPLDKPSAGSTFKRPRGAYAAALIDQCGLRGFAVGGAQVSEKHCGFVINNGNATFSDVLSLMEHIRRTVFRETGIELTAEVKIIDNE